jgi:hypothetical protein
MRNLAPLTVMHLRTAARMPRKEPQIWPGEKAVRQYIRRAKRERNAIAAYYRLLRSGTVAGYGPKQALIAHRYGTVTTAAEANTRIRNLTA